MSKRNPVAGTQATPKQPTITWKCDEFIMQIVVCGYDEFGRKAAEQISDPRKVFRGSTQNIWAEIDAQVKAAIEAAHQRQIVAPAATAPEPASAQ